MFKRMKSIQQNKIRYQLFWMQRLTLITNKICPFAERVWITLEEKKIPYELKEVNLKDKEAQFTETYRKAIGADPSSDGKVPILIDGNTIITESDLTSIYVSEKFENSGNQLIPKDPLHRFQMRDFISRFGKLITNFYGYIKFGMKTEEEQKALLSKTQKIFEELDKALVLPYAMGEEFTLADIMIYPWLLRWVAIEQSIEIKMDLPQRIGDWVKNVQERDSVKKTRQSDEFFVKGYEHYFKMKK